MSAKLETVVGDQGTGKTTWTTVELLPGRARRGLCQVYHSPNADDRPPGFTPLTLRELHRARKVPRALQIVHCTALDAIRAAQRLLMIARVELTLDEAHRAVPNYGATWQEEYTEEERQELRVWALDLLRQGRHSPLSCVFVTPSIRGMHPEVWRASTWTHYHTQSEPSDLRAIEERYGAAAALAVSMLPPFRRISVDRRKLPPGWDGHQRLLARRAKRLGL